MEEVVVEVVAVVIIEAVVEEVAVVIIIIVIIIIIIMVAIIIIVIVPLSRVNTVTANTVIKLTLYTRTFSSFPPPTPRITQFFNTSPAS